MQIPDMTEAPKALEYIRLNDDLTLSAIICAYCDSKADADKWSLDHGITSLSHGICPACFTAKKYI